MSSLRFQEGPSVFFVGIVGQVYALVRVLKEFCGVCFGSTATHRATAAVVPPLFPSSLISFTHFLLWCPVPECFSDFRSHTPPV